MEKNKWENVKQAIRDKYAWPGLYPMFLVSNDGGVICIDCARKNFRFICEDTKKGYNTGWDIFGYDVNWEDENLYCDNCGKIIESAYGEKQ